MHMGCLRKRHQSIARPKLFLEDVVFSGGVLEGTTYSFTQLGLMQHTGVPRRARFAP